MHRKLNENLLDGPRDEQEIVKSAEEVNTLLKDCGFQCCIPAPGNEVVPEESLTAALSVIKKVLGALRTSERSVNEIRKKRSRTLQELKTSEDGLKRASKKAQANEKKLTLLTTELEAVHENHKQSTANLRGDVNQLHIVKSNLIQKDRFLLVELKKMQAEREAAKDRLVVMTREREKIHRPSITMTSTMSPSRNAWTKPDFYRDIVDSFRAREEELTLGNEDLAALSGRIDQQVSTILGIHDVDTSEGLNSPTLSQSSTLSTDRKVLHE